MTSRCFRPRCCSTSQPVAWVLGETLEAAQRGAARVTASSTSRCPRSSPSSRPSRPAASSPKQLRIVDGDTSAIDASPVRIDGELRIGGQEHFYLETQAALAWIDEAGFIAVHSSTQHPSETQEVVARVLGVPRNHVTVECLRMGGAFGGKEVQANPYAAIAALGAWKTRRPVRVRLTRELDMAITGKRHPYLAKYAAGFAADGRLNALRVELFSDGGWSLDLSEPIMWRSMFHIDNAYKLPAVEVTGRVCRTHKTSQTAFRGFGGPQGMLVIEEILSRAAQRAEPAGRCGSRAQFLPRRRRDALRRAGARRRPHRADLERAEGNRAASTSAATRYRALQCAQRPSQARPRDHAGEVRHLVHGHVLQPGRRGRAGLSRRHRAGESRRHRNGAGAVHEDPADRRRQPRRAGVARARHVDAHRQGAEHVGDRGVVRQRSQRRGGAGRVPADQSAAGGRCGGGARLRAGRRAVRRRRRVGAAESRSRSARCARRPTSSACRCSPRVSIARPTSISTSRRRAAGRFTTTRTAPPCPKSKSTALPGSTGCCAPTSFRMSATRSRRSSIAARSRAGFCRASAGSRSKSCCGTRRDASAPPGASTYKLPSWSEVPEVFNVEMLERATQPDVVMGSKAVGEPPLMLAISVREALRDAIAAFGDGDGRSRSTARPRRSASSSPCARSRRLALK